MSETEPNVTPKASATGAQASRLPARAVTSTGASETLALQSAGAVQIGNLRFQNALARRPQRTPPIWLMRQAGRYHRHYQALRKRHSFIDLCKQPELAAEVALGPVLD